MSTLQKREIAEARLYRRARDDIRRMARGLRGYDFDYLSTWFRRLDVKGGETMPNIPDWWAEGTARGLLERAEFYEKMSNSSTNSSWFRGYAEALRFLSEYIRKEGGLDGKRTTS